MSMKKKRRFPLISLLLVAAGAALLLYPTVSDCWNAMVQTRAIASYQERVSDLDEASYADLLEAASLYNAALLDDAARFHPDAQEHAQYTQLLDVSSTGIMGYLEIPCIDMTSPIYHGTSDGVLQIAVGHLEGSSLPVGGKSTHCVLSGHRGLPSARLFSDLDKMREGDVFMIHVLEETLVYEVDQIAKARISCVRVICRFDRKENVICLIVSIRDRGLYDPILSGIQTAPCKGRHSLELFIDLHIVSLILIIFI